jgi:hypothetical protein
MSSIPALKGELLIAVEDVVRQTSSPTIEQDQPAERTEPPKERRGPFCPPYLPESEPRGDQHEVHPSLPEGLVCDVDAVGGRCVASLGDHLGSLGLADKRCNSRSPEHQSLRGSGPIGETHELPWIARLEWCRSSPIRMRRDRPMRFPRSCTQ